MITGEKNKKDYSTNLFEKLWRRERFKASLGNWRSETEQWRRSHQIQNPSPSTTKKKTIKKEKTKKTRKKNKTPPKKKKKKKKKKRNTPPKRACSGQHQENATAPEKSTGGSVQWGSRVQFLKTPSRSVRADRAI